MRENTKKNPPSSFFGGWHLSIHPTFWLQAPRPKKRVLNSTEIEDRFGWNEGAVSKDFEIFLGKLFEIFPEWTMKPTKIHLQDSWRRNNVLTVQDTNKCLIESLFYSISAIPNT